MRGLLPMAASHIIGAEALRPLAVIGSGVSATLSTLRVPPTLYVWTACKHALLRAGGNRAPIDAARMRKQVKPMQRWANVAMSLALGWVGTAWAAAPVDDPATDPMSAPAAGSAADAGEFKLMLGRYRLSGEGAGLVGTDLNLRWRRNGRNLWLGAYQDTDVGR